MTRDITDFNAEYAYKLWCKEREEALKPKKGSVLKSVLFYTFIIGLVLFAYLYSQGGGSKKLFGAYTMSNVITDSMRSVYPVGTLVVSRELEPNEPLSAGLAGGDDIVFSLDDKFIVHRIIDIVDDPEAGMRAFYTQGVDNPEPDRSVTYEDQIVGKVIWHMAGAGETLLFVSENIIFIVAAIVGVFLLIILLRMLFHRK